MTRTREAVSRSAGPGSPADARDRRAGRPAPGERTGSSVVQRACSRRRPPTGKRTLDNVVGVAARAHAGRDRRRRPSRRARLARDRGGVGHRRCSRSSPSALAGETHHRTIVLASTSGSSGAAGAVAAGPSLPRAAGRRGGRARRHGRHATSAPAGRRAVVERPGRGTAACCATRSPRRSRSRPGCRRDAASSAASSPHLAFPFTATEQGPFGADGRAGRAAVGLRRPGARRRRAHQRQSRIAGMGRSALQTVNALDADRTVPGAVGVPPVLTGKVVPAWAIRLFVLALIVPVLGATIDGMARVAAPRTPGPALGDVGARAPRCRSCSRCRPCSAPSCVGRDSTPAPPGPVGAPTPCRRIGTGIGRARPSRGCLIAVGFAVRCDRSIIRASRRRQPRSGARQAAVPGAGAGLLLVLCVVALVIWLSNPFAAALLVPALHCGCGSWRPNCGMREAVALALLLGRARAAGAGDSSTTRWSLGLGPVGLAWSGVLLSPAATSSVLTALEWSVVLGCAVSLVLIAARSVPSGRAARSCRSRSGARSRTRVRARSAAPSRRCGAEQSSARTRRQGS